MKALIACVFLFCFSIQAVAKKKNHTGSIYFSWGYNEEWYTKSTVGIKQDALGNNYQLIHVHAQDHKGWDDGIFNKAISIPQYNYRLGYFFNKKQDLGIEINFDHTKYIITDGQDMTLKGMLGKENTTQTINFSQKNGFYYYLNNGANFLVFNIIKKFPVYHTPNKLLRIELIGKAGAGPVIPHVQNSFFFQPNQQHFQIGGWNTAAETSLRITVAKYGFLEFAQKVVYARYSNLKIYDGTAKQNFGCYELVLTAGFILPTTKHNPLFTH